MATNRKGYVAELYRRKRKSVIKTLGGRCYLTGSSEALELHHIIPLNGNRPNGRLARAKEWQENISNIVLLSKDKHKELHANKTKFEEICTEILCKQFVFEYRENY